MKVMKAYMSLAVETTASRMRESTVTRRLTKASKMYVLRAYDPTFHVAFRVKTRQVLAREQLRL